MRSIFEWTRRTPNRPANRLQTNRSPRKRLRFEDSDNDEIDSNQEPSSLEEASDSVQDDIQNINNKLPSFDEQIMEANRKIEELESKLKELRLERFGLERFSSNPEQLQFYTWFKSYTVLCALFQWLKPTAEAMSTWSQVQRSEHRKSHQKFKACISNFNTEMSLSSIDQFFLFLVRLRQGFPINDLAVRFRVSPSTVSGTILTWANFLYFMFGQLPIWPTKAQVNANMHECFKKTYPNTRVILTVLKSNFKLPVQHF